MFHPVCRRLPTTSNCFSVNGATFIRLQPPPLPQLGNVRRLGSGVMEQYLQNLSIYMTNSVCSQSFVECYQALASLSWISPTAAVVATTFGLRVLTFPLYAHSEKLLSRRLVASNIIRRQVCEKLAKNYDVGIKIDDATGQPVLNTHNLTVQKRAHELLQQTIHDYAKVHKISRGRILCLKLCTFPIWLQFSMGLQWNVLVGQSMTGKSFPGLLWMDTLSQPDQYLVMPFCLLFVSLLNVWAHKWMYATPPAEGAGRFTSRFFDVALLGMSFYCAKMLADMPAIDSVYWLTVVSTNLGQTLLIRHPRVKKLLGIGRLPTDSKTPFRDLFRLRRRQLPLGMF